MTGIERRKALEREKFPEFCPERALVWRLVHVDNLPWIFEHGMPCASSSSLAPSYTSIGNESLIEVRRTTEVPIWPHGMLADYVPFYFTPFSLMAYNIRTGYRVPHVPSERLAIIMSDFRSLRSRGLTCIFTDAHAAAATTQFHEDIERLSLIDWDILQRRDFSTDRDNDPRKKERYQAEALVHRKVPVDAVRGIFVYTDDVKASLDRTISKLGLSLPVSVRQVWYFR